MTTAQLAAVDQPVTTPVTTPAATGRTQLLRSLGSLALDAGVPFATYFVARDVVGTSVVTALIASSVPPLLTGAWSLARNRKVSAVSALVLLVSVASLALSFLSGDVRVIFAKDSALTGVFALGLLLSVKRGRPALADGLRPFVTRGKPARETAWDRLGGRSPEFDRLVRRHSAVFGMFFLVDAVTRLICAAVAPVPVLGWLSTPVFVATIVGASIVSGGLCVDRLVAVLDADAAGTTDSDACRN